jgi:hypothetical protein
MKILQREVVWIHTHFVTDCVYLPAHHARDLQKKIAPVLDQHRIVFGIHFDSRSHDEGLRIVLECIPLPDALEAIASALARICEPIPSRPRRTRVQIEPPARRPRVAAPPHV